MKKMLALILMVSFITTGISSSVLLQEEESFQTWDEYYSEIANEICSEVNGRLKCLDLSFQFSIPVIFQENITCYSNKITNNPEEINVCYSIVSMTKPEIFELVYMLEVKDPDSLMSTEFVREKEVFKEDDYGVVLTPEVIKSIDFSECGIIFSEVIDVYQYDEDLKEYLFKEEEIHTYDCPYEGKTRIVDLAVLNEDSFVIVKMEKPALLTGTIIYILLGIIILIIVYYIISKKGTSKIKFKPRARRKRI